MEEALVGAGAVSRRYEGWTLRSFSFAGKTSRGVGRVPFTMGGFSSEAWDWGGVGTLIQSGCWGGTLSWAVVEQKDRVRLRLACLGTIVVGRRVSRAQEHRDDIAAGLMGCSGL